MKTTEQLLDEAVLVLNQQLNSAFRVFAKNVNMTLEITGARKAVSYNEVFNDFKVSLDDLVDVAIQINPKSISLRKNTRNGEHVQIRQVLCFIGNQMGYSDVEIADKIGSSRSTVTIARHRTEERLIYNDIHTRKMYDTFVKKLSAFENGETLLSAINY